MNATALTWQIYLDDAGVPAGDPSGAGDPPVWSLTLAPTDPMVVITAGTGGFPSNTQLNLTTPLIMPPGNYWLVFYPTMDFAPDGQFGRQPADTTNGNTGQFVNPGGGFGYGTAWQDWSVIGPTQTDIAFRLEGSVIADVPWLSENPTFGTVAPGGSQDVDVIFDSTGLAAGQYLASLDVFSNDPDEPFISLPVTLTVLADADLAITKMDTPDPVLVSETLTYTLMVTNNGPDTATDVVVVDTLPAGVTFDHASAGCSAVGQVVTCDVGDMADGGVANITIVVIAPSVEGTITNTATVSTSVNDPVPGNNTATEDTTVVLEPALINIYLPLILKN